MVFCTYCGQSFTRDEHLERHILTHTNVKPFKCFTCHMSFARRDLLQRHYTVHGRDQNNQEGLPPNAGMIPKSAGRTPIACSNCAKTKTKCDKKFPCSRCASRNLRCTLRPTRRASKQQIASRMNQGADGNVGGNTTPESGSSDVQNTSSRNSPQPQPQLQRSHSAQASLSETSAQPTLQNPISEEKLGEPPSSCFEQSPPSSHGPIPSTIISPMTPPNGFIQTTPMSGYEDFVQSNVTRDGLDSTSPPFLMDWTQMQLAGGYGHMGRADIMLAGDMGLDLSALHAGASADSMLTLIPELTQALPHVPTPLTTPRMDSGCFSDLELSNSTSIFRSTRPGSISDSGVSDLGPIVAAQDGWTCFRCTSSIPPSSCPRTAKVNLERLEQSLRNQEGWSKWRPTWDEADFQGGDYLTVIQLHEGTRDKLLAITQTFLHKALEIHREGGSSTPSGMDSPGFAGSNFVLLPPARILECLLRSYANSFERFFPLSSRGVLDANELMQKYNDKASSLLVLMMIAQGAMVMPSAEARSLTGGLTEACRISLFDVIEKNIIMASDPIVLRSAVLFTVQAAWSGDKWQMDIAMGQRGMYFAMLRHSGILEARTAATPPMSHHGTADGWWGDWISQESRSRLVYSWLMVDQDLSLFHDTAPTFAVTEFGVPMPDSDRLWHAKSAAEWSDVYNQVHRDFHSGYNSASSTARPLSLRDLFTFFLDDEIISQGIELTPLHLRLLLHPLQSLVWQQSQLLSCFSDSLGNRARAARTTVTAASTRQRLEEVQSLLQRWHDLSERYLKQNPMCVQMQAALVIFHLISLNTVTNFPEIERMARREGFDGSFQQMAWWHKRCILDINEAVFHAGQAIRIMRSMPHGVRPPWWPGTVYRVALILWTESLTRSPESLKSSVSPTSAMFPPSPAGAMAFAVDSLPPEHPLVVRYLTKHEGVPALTKRDGTMLMLENGFSVLSYCIDVLDEGVSTRFSEGIRAKLERLARS